MLKKNIACASILVWPITCDAEGMLLSALQALQGKVGGFSQEVRDANNAPLEQSAGIFTIGGNGAFRWVYQSGLEQRIVADGTTLWIIDEGLEQVIIRHQQDSAGHRPADVLAQPELLHQLFSVDELEVGGGFSAELTPLEKGGFGYELIKIAGEQNEVRRLEILDALGNTTEINLNNLLEPPVEITTPANFSPEFDADYDVVDERSF